MARKRILSLLFLSLSWVTIFLVLSGCRDDNPAGAVENGVITWEKAKNPLGGTVFSLAISNNGGNIFSGTRDGAFRSSTNGTSWTETTLSGVAVFSFSIDPGGKILAGTSEGVFRSSDAGESWDKLSINSDSESPFDATLFHPQDVFLAASRNGRLFLSTNDGETWSPSLTEQIETLAMTSLGDILAGGAGGIYRSADIGKTWMRTLSFSGSINTLVCGNDGRSYAGCSINDIGNQTVVFRSEDDGFTWLGVAGASTLPVSGVGSLLIDGNDNVIAGTFSLDNEETTGGGIYRSLDGGENWLQIGLSDTDVQTLITLPDRRIFAGSSEGTFLSLNNGESWQQMNDGLDVPWKRVRVNSIYTKSDDEILVGTMTHGLLRSQDNGDTWRQIALSNVFDVLSFATSANGDIFAGSAGDIYRSVDSGESWVRVMRSFNNQALAIDREGRVFAGNIFSVLRSVDEGRTWSTVLQLNDQATVLQIGEQGEVFVATRGQGILSSFDHGDTWRRTNIGLTDSVVQALRIDASNNLWAGTRSGFFLSEDSGQTWAAMGLASVSISSIVVDIERNIFVASPNGIFYSVNLGQTWMEANTGLPDAEVLTIEIDASGGLLAGTIEGIYQTLNPINHLN